MSFLMRLTATGAAKIAAANAGGADVALTEMAAGDGSGVAVPAPTGSENDLVNEVWRGSLSSLSVSLLDPTIMLAEAVIPIAAGPFTVREIGIFDAAGDLFAYGNFPETFKPSLAQGAAREMLIRASIRVSSTDNITILIDASAVFATQAWCNGRFLQIGANLSDVANPATARTNLGAAPLNSPVFTGDPRAPTPPVGDNDTSIATTAFVRAAIDAVINGSPGALDTLDELAAALGDDANFAATVTNALALRAPLNSPVFTGDPRAPTPAVGDNDTSIATTAFVQAVAAAIVAGAPTNLNTLDELAAAIGDDPNFAATVNAALALRAPLNSPAFTGNPTAPTPAVGDNDTSIATTAFVRAAIDAVVNGSPGALDTLLELAAALGNDANFATTVTNALALRAPINNPVFTGEPRAPTPPQGDNSTRLATTEFVRQNSGPWVQVGPSVSMAGSSSVYFDNIPQDRNELLIDLSGVRLTSVGNGNGISLGLYQQDTPSVINELLLTASDFNVSNIQIYLPLYNRGMGPILLHGTVNFPSLVSTLCRFYTFANIDFGVAGANIYKSSSGTFSSGVARLWMR